jgi:hypothetical protein
MAALSGVALLLAVANGGPAYVRQATAATYVVRRLPAPPGRTRTGGVEIEVTGDRPFPARATDPVLRIGAVAVRQYRHGGVGTNALVFTLPDASGLRDGAPVSLCWEPGSAGRLELPPLRLDAVEDPRVP